MIKSKQLAKAIFELSKEKTENLDAKFFDFVEKKKLQAQLPSVLYHLEKLIDLEQEKNGIQIEVAHEIKTETVKKIKSFLDAEDMPEIIKTKKELIAGFRAKWNGKIYDASVKNSLKKLEEIIIK